MTYLDEIAAGITDHQPTYEPDPDDYYDRTREADLWT